MIRIAVFGDTHGDTDAATRALNALGYLDLILHTGDHYTDAKKISRELNQEILAVAGNCDPYSFGPKEKTVTIGGKKIFLTHGHQWGVKNGILNLFYRGKELGADLVVYGHTHRTAREDVDGMILLNPGSPSYPRDKHRTMALVTIDDSGKIDTSIFDITDGLDASDKPGFE
ncbi:MAG: metallophosphoesterase [Firmicutes bacterium]|nr:metallophosphoesterase [Bacillota bacterium]